MLTEDDRHRLEQVIDFWFNHLKPENWFVQSDQIDQDIRDGFSKDYDYFKSRSLDSLELSGEQILAAIILFDQMPRHMFRNSAQAFETDGLTRSLCRMALAGGLDLKMIDIKKYFLYLPLEHSEDIKDQEYVSAYLSNARSWLNKPITLSAIMILSTSLAVFLIGMPFSAVPQPRKRSHT